MSEIAETIPAESGAFPDHDRDVAGITPPINPSRQGAFLTDVIIELGLADADTIQAAERAAQESQQRIERYLLDTGALDEEQLSRAVAERNGLDHVDLERFDVDMEVAEMISRAAAERYCALPIAFAEDGALLVAVEDPIDSLGVSDIEVMTRCEVRRLIAAGGAIRNLIATLPDTPRRNAALPPRTEPESEPAASVSEPPPALSAPVPDPAVADVPGSALPDVLPEPEADRSTPPSEAELQAPPELDSAPPEPPFGAIEPEDQASVTLDLAPEAEVPAAPEPQADERPPGRGLGASGAESLTPEAPELASGPPARSALEPEPDLTAPELEPGRGELEPESAEFEPAAEAFDQQPAEVAPAAEAFDQQPAEFEPAAEAFDHQPVEVEPAAEAFEPQPAEVEPDAVQFDPEPAEAAPDQEAFGPGPPSYETPEVEPRVEAAVPRDTVAPEPDPTAEGDAAGHPLSASDGKVGELSLELEALREEARRADAAAAAVGRRIEELENADERSSRLEEELHAARSRIVELEQELEGLDAAVADVRDATEQLSAVRRVLEGARPLGG